VIEPQPEFKLRADAKSLPGMHEPRPRGKTVTWAQALRPVILEVLEATKGWPEDERKRALKGAIPEDARTPYRKRIWRRTLKKIQAGLTAEAKAKATTCKR